MSFIFCFTFVAVLSLFHEILQLIAQDLNFNISVYNLITIFFTLW